MSEFPSMEWEGPDLTAFLCTVLSQVRPFVTLDYSQPVFSVHGIFQARILEWIVDLIAFLRSWCWERLRAEGERNDRGWDGRMASQTRWTWVWVGSGSWWWTGRPGVLRFMGSQRVRHDWATELNWTQVHVKLKEPIIHPPFLLHCLFSLSVIIILNSKHASGRVASTGDAVGIRIDSSTGSMALD